MPNIAILIVVIGKAELLVCRPKFIKNQEEIIYECGITC